MLRSVKGAEKIAGRDTPERVEVKDRVELPSPKPPLVKVLHIVAVTQGGTYICPGKCSLVQMFVWGSSANNIKVALYQTDRIEEDEPKFSIVIPIIRGRQEIRDKLLSFPVLEKLDVITFNGTKAGSFFSLTAIFQEL